MFVTHLECSLTGECYEAGQVHNLSRAGKPLKLRVQAKSFDVVAKMIQAGLGIGILPEAAAHSFAGPMGLRVIHLTDAWATRKMYVCIRNRASLAAPARLLVDHLAGRQA